MIQLIIKHKNSLLCFVARIQCNVQLWCRVLFAGSKRLQPEKVIELQFHLCKLIKIAHDNKHCMLSRFMHIIKKTANVLKLANIFVTDGKKTKVGLTSCTQIPWIELFHIAS